MSIRRIGRAVTWLTVYVMAGLSTLAVCLLLLVSSFVEADWRLEASGQSLLVLAVALVVGIAPWWAIAAMYVHWRRSPDRVSHPVASQAASA